MWISFDKTTFKAVFDVISSRILDFSSLIISIIGLWLSIFSIIYILYRYHVKYIDSNPYQYIRYRKSSESSHSRIKPLIYQSALEFSGHPNDKRTWSPSSGETYIWQRSIPDPTHPSAAAAYCRVKSKNELEGSTILGQDHPSTYLEFGQSDVCQSDNPVPEAYRNIECKRKDRERSTRAAWKRKTLFWIND